MSKLSFYFCANICTKNWRVKGLWSIPETQSFSGDKNSKWCLQQPKKRLIIQSISQPIPMHDIKVCRLQINLIFLWNVHKHALFMICAKIFLTGEQLLPNNCAKPFGAMWKKYTFWEKCTPHLDYYMLLLLEGIT